MDYQNDRLFLNIQAAMFDFTCVSDLSYLFRKKTEIENRQNHNMVIISTALISYAHFQQNEIQI